MRTTLACLLACTTLDRKLIETFETRKTRLKEFKFRTASRGSKFRVEPGPKNPHLDLRRVLVALCLAVTLTLSTLFFHAVNIESRRFSGHDSYPDSEI